MRFFALAAIVSVPLLAMACAQAGEDGLQDADETSSSSSSGDGGTTTRSDGGSATPPKGSSSSSGGSSSGASSGGSDAGTSSSSSGGSSSSSGGSSVCTAVACASAEVLTTINGDSGSPSESTQGSGNQWVMIHVKDSAGGGNDISWTMHFVPAAGVTYDVRVIDSSSSSCSSSSTLVAPAKYSTYGGNWTDDVPLSDDGHDVYVQITQTSGTCPSATNWTLAILGNTY